LEGVQASLASGIDNTFWKEQKVGAEEAVIKTKMLLDVHKLMRAAIAETGKLSEEQDKASSKLTDERLKKELDDEKKLNDSVLKVSESQLKLNLVQREPNAPGFLNLCTIRRVQFWCTCSARTSSTASITGTRLSFKYIAAPQAFDSQNEVNRLRGS
jgi:hypothetical protein